MHVSNAVREMNGKGLNAWTHSAAHETRKNFVSHRRRGAVNVRENISWVERTRLFKFLFSRFLQLGKYVRKKKGGKRRNTPVDVSLFIAERGNSLSVTGFAHGFLPHSRVCHRRSDFTIHPIYMTYYYVYGEINMEIGGVGSSHTQCSGIRTHSNASSDPYDEIWIPFFSRARGVKLRAQWKTAANILEKKIENYCDRIFDLCVRKYSESDTGRPRKMKDGKNASKLKQTCTAFP